MTEEKDILKYDKNIWKQIFIYLRPYNKKFLLLLLMMFSLAAIDARFPVMTMNAIDNFIVAGDLTNFSAFIIEYFALVLGISLLIKLFINIGGQIETGTAYTLREEGFRKLQSLSFSYYDKNAVGRLMARVTSDVSRIAEILSWGLVDFFWGFSMMIMIGFNMFKINYKLAFITLSVVPILAIISVVFQRKMIKASRKVRKTNSAITGAYNEGIVGAKTSKTLVREDENLNEFKIITDKMRNQSIHSAVLSASYLPIVLTLSSIGMALALYYGGFGVTNGSISLGTTVLFINYAILFFEPVREMARVFAELQVAQASAERILGMINTPLEISDSEKVSKIYGDNFTPLKENWDSLKGDIEFKNVSFHYLEDEPILKDFNLKVKAGQKIALVGETGSGKSTIVNLACRFYEPISGEILIDGKNYKDRSQLWLHSNLGYVLQSPHLFSGTIRDNIKYGNLEATEDEIIQASKLANAYDFIKKLDKGFDTEVGEGGGMLSTGEKQLISFARAIISNPSIFILDEATSSIDTETEQVIQEAIHNILQGRTSFIIAHRLSTIKNSDRILVLKKGIVIEDGKHNELMSQKGYYYKLYTNQFVDEKELELLA